MPSGPEFDTALLFPRRTAGFLNLWYRTYQEARAALEQHPDRFLFPYREQFVVCERSMLEHLTVDTTDADWVRIGHDWARPADPDAKARLAKDLRSRLERFRATVLRSPCER